MDKTMKPKAQPVPVHSTSSNHSHAATAAPDLHDADMNHPQDNLHNPSHHVPVNYTPGTLRRVAIFAACVLLALGAIFVFTYVYQHHKKTTLEQQTKDNEGQTRSVDVVHVKAAAADKLLTLPGEAHSFYETTMYARTTGYLKDLFCDMGDRVKKDQVLATIDVPDMDDQVTAADAKVLELKAQVKVCDAALAIAQTTSERYDKTGGAASEQERDQKKSEMNSAAAKLEAAKAQVALGEADRARLDTMDKFQKVTAPFDGTITERNIDPGELVSTGSSSSGSNFLFKIIQFDKVRVFVDVPQAAAPDIKVGMSAVTEYGGHKFTGKVDRTAESIDMASRTLKVQVLIDNPERVLLPGTYLQVTFLTTRQHPPLQVPSSALTFRTSGPQVAVVGEDGRVKFRDVHITLDSGDLLEVDGLSGNERVALNIGNSVADGDIVNCHDLDARKAEGAKVAEAPAKSGAAAR